MFHPDPKGLHTVEELIAKLTDIKRELPANNPRATHLTETIRRLQTSQARRPASPEPNGNAPRSTRMVCRRPLEFGFLVEKEQALRIPGNARHLPAQHVDELG